MKQISFYLLLVTFIISCAGKSTSVKSGDLAYAQMNPTDEKSHQAGKSGSDVSADTALHISAFIRTMFQDKSGKIWFGTYSNGVSCYDGKILKNYTKKDGLSGNIVREIIQTRDGNIWFATNEGVSSFNGKAFTKYTTQHGLISDQVWTILEDKKGMLWFGTDNGVCRYDRKAGTKDQSGFNVFPLPSADLTEFPNAYPAPKLVNKIFQDKSENIWFATNGQGVYEYVASNSSDLKNFSLVHFTEREGLCNNFIESIFQDAKGSLWFGSRFGGVSRLDAEKQTKMAFENYNVDNGLSNNFVWNIGQDDNGMMWFATAGGGVDSYDSGTLVNAAGKDIHLFTNYRMKDGLPDDYVQCILKDKKGNLWFGTGSGLSRYDGTIVPEGKPKFTKFLNNGGTGC